MRAYYISFELLTIFQINSIFFLIFNVKKTIASSKKKNLFSLTLSLSSFFKHSTLFKSTFHLPLFSSFQPQSLSIISFVTAFTPQFTTLTLSRFFPQHKSNSKFTITTQNSSKLPRNHG